MPDDGPRYVPPGSLEDDVPAFGVAGDQPMQYRGPVEKVPGANRALIVAILGFLFPAAGVIGFSMGRRADALAAQTGGRYNGRGTAKAAIVFGALAVAAWLVGIGYYWFVWRKSS